MNSASTFSSLEPFDLLPPSFRYQNRVRHVVSNWLATVCMLIAMLCGITVATVMRIQQERRRNEGIAATAIPLIKLRKDVLGLQANNQQREAWLQGVTAARPGDDLLQTIAAIAVASRTEDRAIIIDSLQVRQPIEHPVSTRSTPEWAIPRIEIEARVQPGAVAAWVNRLSDSDRINAAEVISAGRARDLPALSDDADPNLGGVLPIEVIATPRWTRVLP